MGQLRGQRRALWFLAHLRRSGGGLQSLQFGFDGGNVGVEQIIEEAGLRRVQMFTALGKAMALEQRDS